MDAIPDLVGCSGHYQDDLSGPNAASGRGSGHLSADNGHAGRAGGCDSPWLFLFQRQLCLCHFRRRDRPLLGPLSGSGISVPGCAHLPDGAAPALGPDATGVGWIYQYALVDRTGQHDLADLRSLQDWFLKYELQTIEGVSEVATIGGMVRQYQVVADPDRLRA